MHNKVAASSSKGATFKEWEVFSVRRSSSLTNMVKSQALKNGKNFQESILLKGITVYYEVHFGA